MMEQQSPVPTEEINSLLSYAFSSEQVQAGEPTVEALGRHHLPEICWRLHQLEEIRDGKGGGGAHKVLDAFIER